MHTAFEIARTLRTRGVKPAPVTAWLRAGWPPELPSNAHRDAPKAALAVLRLAAAGVPAAQAGQWLLNDGPVPADPDVAGPVIEKNLLHLLLGVAFASVT